MKSAVNIAYLLLIVTLCSSCKKSKEEPEFEYGPFNYGTISGISANGTIVIELVQGTTNQVVRKTTGGPQIVSGGGALIMNGSGTVTIAVKDPLSISMNGYGGIKTSGLVTMKSLYISNQSSTIVMDSLIIEDILSVQLNNTGDCKISGHAGYLSIGATNLPTFYGFNLITDSCFVNATTMGQIQVNTRLKLKGTSYGSGNIYYKGNPSSITLDMLGSGKLFAN